MEKLLKVKVKPDSKRNHIEKIKDDEFVIETKAAAEGGKANKNVILILADYFKTPPSKVIIIKGQKSHSKIIKIYS
ncbi:MAG: DUF167 family protein [Elusimicrobiota bacterium]